MSNYVIPKPTQPSLPVRGTNDRFPVRRIYCIGRNYADHAIEMGYDPGRTPSQWRDRHNCVQCNRCGVLESDR